MSYQFWDQKDSTEKTAADSPQKDLERTQDALRQLIQAIENYSVITTDPQLSDALKHAKDTLGK